MNYRGTILLAVTVALSCWVGPTSASTFRPIPLSRLVQQSNWVVVATPVSFECHWATVGSGSRLVTDFTLQVHWTLRGVDVAGQEIVVRTLGGSWGNLGQVVHGEAHLAVGQTSLLFLKRGHDNALRVLGLGQGHYPVAIDTNGDWRLTKSPGLEGVLDEQHSAATLLFNQRLDEVKVLLEKSEVTP